LLGLSTSVIFYVLTTKVLIEGSEKTSGTSSNLELTNGRPPGKSVNKQTHSGVGSIKKAVTARKIQANRQNALKSTGPKSPRGKGYSRQNAVKHGLFALDPFICDVADTETKQQYRELLDRLAESYQPVGAAEQLEVERIAACWWKLGRAWRYENSEIALGHANVAIREQEVLSRSPLLSEKQARLALLTSVKAEIESTGEMSEEFKARIFAADPEFREQWEFLEKLTKERLGEVLDRLGMRPSVARQLTRDSTYMLLITTEVAIHGIERKAEWIMQSASKAAHDRVAIPESEALDRVLRADAAAERNLGRAIDRLERLQRRRQGDAVPPPVNFRLSR
jgi:hypothetical protein